MTVELLGDGPDRVARLGGVAPVGPAVSWCPPGIAGWQPVSAYLVRRGTSAVLVDTGVGLHTDQVVAQLHELLAPGTRLSVVLTRTEMECCLNLPAIERELAVDQVWYTGGITVPVTHAAARRITVEAGTPQDVEVAPGITLRLYTPLLRLLPVLWVGDPVSRTLLTSDSFSHLLTDAEGHALPYDAATLRAFHDLKFGWIADAVVAEDIAAIADDVRRVLGDDWAALGPTYGAPVVGRDAVRTQGADLVAYLEGVGRRAA
ncbi:hypothetical protein [Pimelobacter sp. 30-1]|uniref:hypothetical protein n=1 Tax=Pimelobacter sp. 30-1 TaxID=2004991 RepID=UPI001C05C18F|nr:hypothetical protein [Pimelobacter sp. 30-1]